MIRIDFPDVAALQPGVVLRCYHFLCLPQRVELEPVQESPSALCCVELHLLLVQYPVRRERRARGEVLPGVGWQGRTQVCKCFQFSTLLSQSVAVRYSRGAQKQLLVHGSRFGILHVRGHLEPIEHGNSEHGGKPLDSGLGMNVIRVELELNGLGLPLCAWGAWQAREAQCLLKVLPRTLSHFLGPL